MSLPKQKQSISQLLITPLKRPSNPWQHKLHSYKYQGFLYTLLKHVFIQILIGKTS